MSDLSISEYRTLLERVDGGTVPARLALEIVDAAEKELDAAHGEYTVSQAMHMSGRSRSWFERRLPEWRKQKLARRVGRVWLLKRGAIPIKRAGDEGFDVSLSPEEVARRLLAEVAA